MKRIALTLAALTIAGAASAQTAPAVEDADGNGSYSMQELQVSYPELTAADFTAIDKNADGAVDQVELAAAIADGALPAG